MAVTSAPRRSVSTRRTWVTSPSPAPRSRTSDSTACSSSSWSIRATSLRSPSPESRLELARLAFDSLPATVDLDDHRFTVDLLESHPLDDALFLIGADEFAGFLSWKEPERVLELARLGVATRPGYPRERLDAVLGQLERPERVELFELEPTPVSSTEVRERVSLGVPLDGLVPPAVAARSRELSPSIGGD